MFKKASLWLHKWLGLFTGLVIFVVSFTGAIYTFHDELKLFVYPDKYFIETTSKVERLPLSILIQRAQDALPKGERISRVDLYPSNGRSWIFRASETNEGAFGHWSYFRYYKRVFVNPYTGECVAVEDSKNEFFQLVLQLHMNLLLGKTYGHALVAYSTLVFTFLLFTGMILWWPKKWKGKSLKRSIWLNRKTKWKRFNYDLHNVWGFYTFPIAFVLCITGLLFSFPNWKESYSRFIDQITFLQKDQTPVQELAQHVINRYDQPIDNLLAYVLERHPNAGMMSIRLRGIDAPVVDVQVRLQEDRSGLFRWYYMKTSDLNMNEIRSNQGLSNGELMAALNFDLHTGSIGGMGTKILVFLISLGCASLPVTGYILWWNKRKPKGIRKKAFK